MKKCIKCAIDIDDNCIFCPGCGHKQDSNEKIIYPISSRAFLRIFRPSFFGLNTQLDKSKTPADTQVFCTLILNYLSLERQLSATEIYEINEALHRMLTKISDEYVLSNQHPVVVIDESMQINIDNEKFRYNFISDFIFHTINKYQGRDNENIFSIIWLFALLSCLNGHYSDEKSMFFHRLKNLFPISSSKFRKAFTRDHYADLNSSRMTSFLRNWIFPITEAQKKEQLAEGDQEPVVDDVSSFSIEDISEDFDFYTLVENTIMKLCDIESKIQQLEHSEGSYLELLQQINVHIEQERNLLEILPCFSYTKY